MDIVDPNEGMDIDPRFLALNEDAKHAKQQWVWERLPVSIAQRKHLLNDLTQADHQKDIDICKEMKTSSHDQTSKRKRN
jgi:hypothetical protein